MNPEHTSADQFISCPIHTSKNPDFPVRVTQRAIDVWAGKISLLGFFRSIDMLHVTWDPADQYPVVKINEAYLPFVETYEKIKGLKVAIIKKEAELLQGAILDYYDWPMFGAEGVIWMPPVRGRGIATDPGGLKLSLERLTEIHPELTGPAPSFWKTMTNGGSAEGQSYLRDFLSKCLWVGDTRAVVVMKCKPLILASYVGDFRSVVLLRYDDEFAESAMDRLHLKIGSRLVATHTFNSAGELASDLDTPNNPLTNPWRNVSSYIGEFLSDDTERLRELHKGITEDEWLLCADLGRQRMQQNVPCRDGRPLLSEVRPERMDKVKYPYGNIPPQHYQEEE